VPPPLRPASLETPVHPVEVPSRSAPAPRPRALSSRSPTPPDPAPGRPPPVPDPVRQPAAPPVPAEARRLVSRPHVDAGTDPAGRATSSGTHLREHPAVAARPPVAWRPRPAPPPPQPTPRRSL